MYIVSSDCQYNTGLNVEAERIKLRKRAEECLKRAEEIKEIVKSQEGKLLYIFVISL